jgi:type II secretory pathway pseudopilin PulG
MSKVRTERTVTFLLAIAVVIAVTANSLSTSKFDRRMSDMAALRGALASYQAKNGKYPPQNPQDLAIGISDPAGANGIDALVPLYISAIPRDPQNLNQLNRQYLYFSNGSDYKLVAHGTEDIGWVIKNRPELIDPVRPTVAYGIWTAGAAKW